MRYVRERNKSKMKWTNNGLRIAAAISGTAAMLLLTAVLVYVNWEKEPTELTQSEPSASPGAQNFAATRILTTPEPDRGVAFDTKRQDGVYTILLVGNDDGNGNTDTIMLAKLDSVRHELNIVSIPRDTIINIDSGIRKLNSVYWTAVLSGESGIESLKTHIEKLCGFEPDCYAVIDIDVFSEAVDAVGGIWFDVPQRLYYDGGPVIDLEEGWQCLNGEQAIGLCRYRSYVMGDLDRIEMQHHFLEAAAEQFLDAGNIPEMGKIFSMLSKNMDTNLSAANMAWFMRQTLMCGRDGINFYTAPCTPANVQGLSYTFLRLYDWLEMINSKINPFDRRITEGMLDVVYLHNGDVSCTTVLRGAGYYDLGKNTNAETYESAENEEWEEYEEAEDYVPSAPEWVQDTEPAPIVMPTPAVSLAPDDDDWLELD